MLCGSVRNIRTSCLRTSCALRSHITLGTTHYGGHRHGLLFKIGLRAPMCPTFEVNVARLAGDARPIRGAAVWRVAADCSCMFERVTRRRVWNRGKDSRFSGF